MQSKKTGKETTVELDSDYDSEYEQIESTGKDFAGKFLNLRDYNKISF